MYKIVENLFFRFAEKKCWLKLEAIRYHSEVRKAAKNLELDCNLELEYKITMWKKD